MRGSRKAPTPMVDESRMESGNCSLSGLDYTSWPGGSRQSIAVVIDRALV